MRNNTFTVSLRLAAIVLAITGWLVILPGVKSRGLAPNPSTASINRPASPGKTELSGLNAARGERPFSLLAPAGPTITATKQDALVNDVNSNGKANPGDTLGYTVVINNTGMGDATGVSFTDTIDPNTTLVPGSVNTSPIAFNDSYSAIGNVSISPNAAQGLLANDFEPDGNTMTVIGNSTPSCSGANLTVNADGSFTFNPPPGFEGACTFTYTVSDGQTPPLTDTATVTINVSGMIWFVDNSQASNGDGRLGTPFNSLANFVAGAADDPGDNIFLYRQTATNYSGSITLLNNQRLIGQGATASLSTITGLTPQPYSAALPSTGGINPVITSAGNTVVLGSGNTIRGFNLSNTGGTALSGTSFGNLTALEMSVSNSSGIAINLNTGNPTATFSSVSASNGTNGIILQNTTGTFTVSGTGGTCTEATPTCTGGTISGTTGGDSSAANPPGTAIVLNNVTNVSFTRMHISGNSNYGIRGTSVNGFTFDNGVINGVNGTNVASPFNDSSMRFDNLSGTANITNSAISGGFYRNIQITNTTGTLDLTINNSSIHDTGASQGDDGIFLENQSTANITAHITNNTFSKHGGDHFNGSLLGTGTIKYIITGNLMTGGHAIGLGQGIFILAASFNSPGNLQYDISNNGTAANPLVGNNSGAAIFVDKGSGSGSFTGRIQNNVIGSPGSTGSGSLSGAGIDVEAHGTGSHSTNISNNLVRQYHEDGIRLVGGEVTSGAPAGSLTFDATITGNTVSNPDNIIASSDHGIHINMGTLPTDNLAACMDVKTNTLSGAGEDGDNGTANNGSVDLRIRQRQLTTVRLPGFAGGANADAFESGQNTLTTVATSAVSTFGGGGACASPIIPAFAAPLEAQTTSIDVPRSDEPQQNYTDYLFAPETGRTSGASPVGVFNVLSIAQEALARWKALGVSGDDLARLEAVQFEVADLPDDQLAVSTPSKIIIDENAADFGWFIDPSPDESSEFNRRMRAKSDSPAFGKMDLLTVVTRSLGYVLNHKMPSHSSNRKLLLMRTLPPSIRMVPIIPEDKPVETTGHLIDDRVTPVRKPQLADDLLSKTVTDVDLLQAPAELATRPRPAYSGLLRRVGFASHAAGSSLDSFAPSTQPRTAASHTAAPMSGETVSKTLNTLPPGKTVTIVFRVTVNNPLPAGVVQVCNQGTVSGSNFSNVVTDDPDTGTAADPTCTTICVPPVVTTPITNQQVAQGTTATFTTTIQGNSPFVFVWKKNGTTLVSGVSLGGRATINTTSGSNSSTSTLSISSTVLSDSDTYTVDATDACGTATTQQTATLTVVAPPTVSKAFGASTIPLNGSTSLTLTLTNPNTGVTLTGVNFSDNFPAGLEVANPANPTTTCTGTWNATPGDTTLNFGGGTLPPGSSCTLSVNVKGTTAGVKNNATNAPQSNEGGAGVASNTATLTVVAPPTISKAFSPGSIFINGASSQLTFTLTNPNSTVGLTGVAFTDVLPSGLQVAPTPGASTTCGGTFAPSAGDTTLTFSGGSIAASGTCTVTVNVIGTSAGAKANTTGAITSTEGGTGATSNTATINVFTAPQISKAFGASFIAVGGTTTLTFTISNPAVNPGNLTTITFIDSLPAGLVVANPNGVSNTCSGSVTAVPGAGTVSLGGASVAPGNSCQVVVDVTGTTSGVKNNSVTVSSGNGGTGNTAMASITVASPPTITKAFGASTIQVGGTTSLDFTITNPNTALGLTGIAFTDTLPAGLTVADGTTSTCGGTLTTTAPSTISFSGGTLAASGTCSFGVTVTGASGGVQNNTTGVISSTESGPGATSNTATITVIGPPSISKAFESFAQIAAAPTGATETGNTVTITTTSPHNFGVGQSVTIAGVGVAGFNGTFTVTSVATATTFTYTNPTAGLAASGGGTATGVIATIPLNGTATLVFTLTNNNSTTSLTGVAFTDALPAGLEVAATPNASTSCGGTFTPAAGDTTLTFSGGTISPSGTCTVRVDVTATTAGVKNNTSGSVTSNEGGTGNTASASITVLAPPTISKAFGAANISLGGTTSLTFTITNPNASVALFGVAFMDTLPAGLTTPDATTSQCGGTLTVSSNVITLTGASIAAGDTCTFSVTVTGATAGVKNNTTGAVTSINGGTGATSNTATVTVATPPTLMKAFGTSSILVGGTTTLTFTITNPNSSLALTGIGFTDTLPAGLTVANGTTTTCGGGTLTTTAPGTISFAGGGLAASGSCSFNVTVTGAAAGVWNNTTGAISSNESGAGATSNTATLTVIGPPTISKAFDASTIPLGGTSVLTFTITNPNPTTALTGIAFTDTLPAGLTVATSSSTTCGGGTLTTTSPSTISLAGGSIVAAGNCTITVTVTGATAGVKNNTTGAVTSANGGTGTTSNTATITVVAPPTISKAFGAPNIPLNGSTTLTFTITNPNSTVALTGVAFTDALPAGLQVAATPGASSSCGGTFAPTAGDTTLTFSGGTIPASGTCTVVVNITGTTAGVKNNTTGAVTSTNGGTGATSNTASLTVASPPTISKAFGASTIPLGGTTSLTFTITNTNATLGITGVAFTDTLPAGLTVANGSSATCGGGTLTTSGGNTISLSGGSIAAGGSCMFSVTVTGTTAGVKNNTSGAVSATETGTGATSNTATLTVVAPPTIGKAFGAATVPLNQTTNLTFTISNPNATVALTGVGFTDTLPAGLTVANGSVAQCGGTLTTSGNNLITLSGASVAAGGTCVFSVTVTGTTAGVKNNTTGAVTSANGGTGTTSNTATITVVAPPTITKSFGAAVVPVGGTTTLTFTLTNPNATVALTGVGFTDAFPAGLVVANPPNATDTCGGTFTPNPGDTSLTFSGGTIAAGGSCVITVSVQLTTGGLKSNTTSAITSTNGGTGLPSNTAVVSTFDTCLQDDGNPGALLLFDSTTGDYMFCCGSVHLMGKGTITKKGCSVTLSQNGPDRRVSAAVDKCAMKGTASLQFPIGVTLCNIIDRNISNNDCACVP